MIVAVWSAVMLDVRYQMLCWPACFFELDEQNWNFSSLFLSKSTFLRRTLSTVEWRTQHCEVDFNFSLKKKRNDSVLFLFAVVIQLQFEFFLPNRFPFLSDFSSLSSLCVCVCILCIGEFCILHSHCLHFMSMYIGVTSKSVHFCRIANYMWEIVRDRWGRSQS